MSEYIRLTNLTKRFKKKVVLDKVNLSINKGEIFGIIGMSGSGKTTLLNNLISFIEPEEGDILFYSEKDKKLKSIYKDRKEARRQFGFATQAASFYPKLTVRENLIHFGSLYGLHKKKVKANAEKLLKLTNLENAKNTLAQNLSGGMEKKLGIACSLMHNPSVLILDEPTADLDPLSRADTWKLVNDINKAGTTIIVASHFLSEIEVACDRVGILYNKKIVAVGSPSELKSKHFKSDEIRLMSSPGKYKSILSSLSKSRFGIQKVNYRDKALLLYTTETQRTIARLLNLLSAKKEKLISLDVSKPPLDEVFESIRDKK